MKNQQLMRDLNEAWERSTERAVENAGRDQELTTVELNRAAGMRLRSGFKSGAAGEESLWSLTCRFDCTAER